MLSEENFILIISIFCGVFVAIATTLYQESGTNNGIKILQQQAVERGVGLYCPQNSEFAWVGEC